MFLSSSEGQNIVMEQIDGRIEEWHSLKDEGVLDCSPPKPHRYMFAAWDIMTVEHQIKRKNFRISLHSMEEFKHLETTDILLIYDIDQGGLV